MPMSMSMLSDACVDIDGVISDDVDVGVHLADVRRGGAAGPRCWQLRANTCYAIEGNVKVLVPEWGDQWVQIGLEQDACFDGHRIYYLGGRQTRWHLVR